MVEEVKDTGFKIAVTMSNSIAPRSIMDITSSEHERFDTGIQELNRVLGGGLNAVSKELYIVLETNVETIEKYIDDIKPVFIIIDSIQTLFKTSISSAPGSVSQVRECANELMRIGKTKAIMPR
jgi:DNA repair protein RadA/Sms